MAKTTLPTNYVDDVLNGAMDGKRRYREIPNADGTISLEDATTYDQVGSNFGASQLNLMSDNINQSFDSNKMLKTMDEVNAVTQEGYGVDALVVKQVNDSLAWWIANGFLPDPNSGTWYLIKNTNTYTTFNFNFNGVTLTPDSVTNTMKLDNNHIEHSYSVAQACYCNINTTNYSKAVLKLKKVTGTTNFLEELTFHIRANVESEFNPVQNIIKGENYVITDNEQTIELDISDYTGNYYLAIGLGGSIDAYISELYLET